MSGSPFHARRPAPARAPGRVLAAVLCMLAAACDDRPEGDAARTAPETVSEIPAAPPVAAIAGKRWLDPADRTPPEQWLASRMAGVDRPPDDPVVARLRDLLARADRAYDESPRMIANRAAQVQEMLAEKGIVESAESVIEGLLTVAGEGATHGFGEAGQHYVNLRATGEDRAAALAALHRAAGGERP